MNGREKLFNLKNKATGIGSVPHTDVNSICNMILDKCPNLPYWPQAVNIDIREGMMLQYTENFPCLKRDLENNDLLIDKSVNKDEKILEFFENLTSNNYEYFNISRDFARGFYAMLEKVKDSNVEFMKGQVVGPVTLLFSVIGEDDKPIIFDDILADAIIRGLAMKCVWQAKQIRKIGKIPILFFDEPAMSGFGSAFMSLNANQALDIFEKFVDTVKEHEDVLIGMHICGNSDWDTVLQSKIDIINFDAYSFAENFVLYSDAIQKYLNRDGIIAWGAVPTSEYNESVNLDKIYQKLNNAFNALSAKGVDKKYLLRRSLFTPACGIGTLSVEVAEKVTNLTFELAERMSEVE